MLIIQNSTINRELSLLRRAYNLAKNAEPPKVSVVPRFPKLAEHNVRKGVFEHHQYTALYAALPEHLKPLLMLAYYTGTRRGELLKLQWTQVDLDHRIIRLEPGETKNKDARLHGERDPKHPWVFT
jgi:integrase